MIKEAVSFELFKKHTRTDDYNTDDDSLASYLEAATVHVTTATNRSEDELFEMGGGNSYPLPLQQAIFMLAAHWFNQRESVSSTQMYEVPDALQALIKPYRKLSNR